MNQRVIGYQDWQKSQVGCMLHLYPKDGPKPCPTEYYIQPFVLSEHGDYVSTGSADELVKWLPVGGLMRWTRISRGTISTDCHSACHTMLGQGVFHHGLCNDSSVRWRQMPKSGDGDTPIQKGSNRRWTSCRGITDRTRKRDNP